MPLNPRRVKRSESKKPLPVIGWRERLAIPDFSIDEIKVKVDTGARTSSLHAFDMKSFTRDGCTFIRFSIHPYQRSSSGAVVVEAPLLERRYVRPSTGKAKLRPVVEVPVVLGEVIWPVEITLIRRDLMGFRMLLGRQAVRGRYLVDSSRSYLAGRPKVETALHQQHAPRPNLKLVESEST